MFRQCESSTAQSVNRRTVQQRNHVKLAGCLPVSKGNKWTTVDAAFGERSSVDILRYGERGNIGYQEHDLVMGGKRRFLIDLSYSCC